VAYLGCLTRLVGAADRYSQPLSPPDDLEDSEAALNSVIVVQSQLHPTRLTGQRPHVLLLTNVDIEHLLASSDHKLLRNMQKWEHCLYHLLPSRKDNNIELRPAGHDFTLPICNYELRRRYFVVRCLVNFITA